MTPPILDLADRGNKVPTHLLVMLILGEAIQCEAVEIEFSLEPVSSAVEILKDTAGLDLLEGIEPIEVFGEEAHVGEEFSIIFSCQDGPRTPASPPSCLFDTTVRVLLTMADLPYWTKGRLEGSFETRNPASRWQITSENIKKRVLLQRLDARQHTSTPKNNPKP